jgi:hypothetical protein
MKKQLVMTTAMAAALAALPGCSSNNGWNEDAVADRETAVCVDQQGTRVDDDLCDDDDYRYGGGGGNAFLWYYLGRSSAIPYYGDSIHHRRYGGRGSFVPTPGVSYGKAPASTRITRSQAVSRGGLGSSGRRYGGGRS